jgi:arsenite methyltransferase
MKYGAYLLDNLPMSESIQKPSYGVDAPDLLRFFFVAGVISSTLLITASLSSLLGVILQLVACALLAIIYS